MLKVRQIRFTCQAVDSVYFGHAGNTFRGALTPLLQDRASLVIPRVSGLDRLRVAPGTDYEFGFFLLRPDEDLSACLETSVKEIAESGIGAGRGRSRLTGIRRSDQEFNLSYGTIPCSRIRIRFVTPVELKIAGQSGPPGEFSTLFRRVSQRLRTIWKAQTGSDIPSGTLRDLWSGSTTIQTIVSDLRRDRRFRRSSRTGQSHPIGGFRGSIDYSGELGPYLTWLRAAECTGIGRHTAWGNGEIAIEPDF